MNPADLQTRLAEAQNLFARGDLAGAGALLEAILRVAPGEPNTLHMLAAVKQRSGDQTGALRLFDEATRRTPGAAPFHFNRANLLLEMGRNADAIDGYDTALKLRPQHAESWRNRARALREIGRLEEALPSCERALRLAPDDLPAQEERALILFALERYLESANAFAAVTRAQPGNAAAHFNHGRTLQELGRLEEALAAYDRAAALEPADAAIHHNRATALYWLGRRDAAMAAFDASLAQRPDHVDTLYTKGVAHLAFGELAEGWRLHALRRQAGSPIAIEDLSRGEPEWNGERVGVLRLWREQGVGDEVLFARLAPLARARVGRVIIECGERLVPLFARSFPKLQVCAQGHAHAADAQCPMGGVGQFVAPSAGALGGGAPYLRADEQRRAALRARYAELARGRPIVGIAWTSINPRLGRHKSAALAEWRALLERDYFFVSLQYGDVAADIEAARTSSGATIYADPDVDQLASLDDFAAQVAAMDAIVSVSNTTVHFAGALGVPCIALAPPAQGLLWYWGVTGEATPWYRSVRLVRRAPAEGWARQVARAATLFERDIAAALRSGRVEEG
jgi:tetratricopeptide (TPR) repeat protein